MNSIITFVLFISTSVEAIATIYHSREAILWLVILVVTIWKRTRSRFRGTVLPIPDDALAY